MQFLRESMINRNQKKRLFILLAFVSIFTWINYFFINKVNFASFLMGFVTLLFMPGLPLYILLQNKKHRNLLRNCIVYSLCIWLIFGFIHNSLQLGNLKLYLFIFQNLLFISYIFFINRYSDSFSIISLLHFDFKIIKKKMNELLFVGLIFVVCIFWLIRIPYLPTEDTWYHISLSRSIVNGVFQWDSDIYWGKLAYHYLGAIFSIYSQIELFTIARAIIFFQLPLFLSIFRALSTRFLKNKSIQILVQLALIMTLFGTILNFSQYWPTAITSILILEIFNDIFEEFEKWKNTQAIKFKVKTSFLIDQTLKIFAIMVCHISNLSLYMVFILFICVIFWVTDKRFLPYCIFYFIAFIVNLFINREFITIFIDSSSLLYNYPWIIIIGAVLSIVVGFFAIKFFKSDTYDTTKIPTGNTGDVESKNTALKILKNGIFSKYVIPIVSISSFLVFLILKIIQNTAFSLEFVSFSLQIVCIAIIISMAVLTFNIFRNRAINGKIMFLNFIAFVILFLFIIVFDFISSFLTRLLIFYTPFLFIGFILYLRYNLEEIKMNNSKRVLFGIFILLNFFSGLLYHMNYINYISESENRFIANASKFSHIPVEGNNQSAKNESIMIIGGFRWKHPFYYYSENYEIYYRTQYVDLVHPDNHYNNLNRSNFEIIQNQTGISNIFIMMEERYFREGIRLLDGGNAGILTQEEYLLYFNSDFINHVAIGNHLKSLFLIS